MENQFEKDRYTKRGKANSKKKTENKILGLDKKIIGGVVILVTVFCCCLLGIQCRHHFL